MNIFNCFIDIFTFSVLFVWASFFGQWDMQWLVHVKAICSAFTEQCRNHSKHKEMLAENYEGKVKQLEKGMTLATYCTNFSTVKRTEREDGLGLQYSSRTILKQRGMVFKELSSHAPCKYPCGSHCRGTAEKIMNLYYYTTAPLSTGQVRLIVSQAPTLRCIFSHLLQ